MKKIIKLTESDLHRIVTESVQRILEAHGEGLSYGTVKSAYNKMNDLGQYDRAAELNKTYGEVNNDEDAIYNLHNDEITFDGGEASDPVFYGNHVTPSEIEKGLTRRTKRYKDGKSYDADSTNPTDFIPQAARVTDAKSAIRRANHLNNFSGRKQFNKNHFRS